MSDESTSAETRPERNRARGSSRAHAEATRELPGLEPRIDALNAPAAAQGVPSHPAPAALGAFLASGTPAAGLLDAAAPSTGASQPPRPPVTVAPTPQAPPGDTGGLGGPTAVAPASAAATSPPTPERGANGGEG